MTRDLRTLIYLLNLESVKNVREHCHSMGPGHGLESSMHAVGEQQSKGTQSGEQQLKLVEADGAIGSSS